MWIRLGFRSTNSPARKRSEARLPAIFKALYAGGLWSISPTNGASAASNDSRVHGFACIPSTAGGGVLSERGSTYAVSDDSGSSVSVVAPSLIVASYCFAPFISSSHRLVARPTSTSNTPVANESSVPAWPTLVPRGKRVFTRPTTRAEVIPAGLSTTITLPMAGSSSVGGPSISPMLSQNFRNASANGPRSKWLRLQRAGLQ